MSNPPPPPNPSGQQPYVAPQGSFDEPRKTKGVSGLLIGCLAVFGVCVLMCAGLGFYVYSNATQFIVQTARTATEAMLNDSGLPDEERQAIMEQFDRVATAYEEGEITAQEMGEIMQDLAESPLISIVIFQAIEAKYLNSSGLSEEEVADAKRTLNRVVRGVQEEKLTKEDIDKLSRHILMDPQPGQPAEQKQLKNTLTDEELRAFFADAKVVVDEHEIPDEEFEMKISEVVEGVVDEILSKP